MLPPATGYLSLAQRLETDCPKVTTTSKSQSQSCLFNPYKVLKHHFVVFCGGIMCLTISWPGVVTAGSLVNTGWLPDNHWKPTTYWNTGTGSHFVTFRQSQYTCFQSLCLDKLTGCWLHIYCTDTWVVSNFSTNSPRKRITVSLNVKLLI